jgi:hypothetical protein
MWIISKLFKRKARFTTEEVCDLQSSQGPHISRSSEQPVKCTETEEDQIKGKIENLKKQAEDRNIYDKSLQILAFFNKDKRVCTYVDFTFEKSLEPAERRQLNLQEIKEMEEAGIITHEHGNLIIKKDGYRLSIINKKEEGGKTVFEWVGVVRSDTGNYSGAKVCSYIPGSWEKDIDQLFIEIQEEEKRLKELTEKQRERQEKERWGL